MEIPCDFLTPLPVIYDVYKVPDLRYVCRSVERNKQFRSVVARYVGNCEDDCDVCPYYKHSCDQEQLLATSSSDSYDENIKFRRHRGHGDSGDSHESLTAFSYNKKDLDSGEHNVTVHY